MSMETVGDYSASDESLYMSMELGESTWKLGFTRGLGQKTIMRRVEARDTRGLLSTLASLKQSLGLSEDVRVRSSYEAGRDGFWLHRFLVKHGTDNLVMD